MSTENKDKKEDTRTPLQKAKDRVATSQSSLVSAVENVVKLEGKTPEQTFGNKCGDGVKTNWKNGAVATEETIRRDLLSVCTSKNPLTSNGVMTLVKKLGTFAYRQSFIDVEIAKLKKENKDITPDQINEKLKGIESLNDMDKQIRVRAESAKSKSKSSESTA